MEKYLIGIDQSTQGTKAILFSADGKMIARADRPHKQYIDEKGWVEHDGCEIYDNTLAAVKEVMEKSGIPEEAVAGVGISNQRETSIAWDKKTGLPVFHAVVWQCTRGAELCRRLDRDGFGERVREKTGLPLSPYYSAAKLGWILENVAEARALADKDEMAVGTMDSYLLYRLTGGKAFKTDYSNASRTQLLNIGALEWDTEIAEAFGLPLSSLPELCDSDGYFGETDFDGLFKNPLPIHAMLGDSHAALYGHGCFEKGMAKVTYGTGSSIMMNVGDKDVRNDKGLVTSVAFKTDGRISYCLEGNINYSAAIVTWLKNDLNLIETPGESEEMAREANPADRTYLVPAFTGLGAPYYRDDVSAAFLGMSRNTGRKELVKACLEAIVYQITDVVKLMQDAMGEAHIELRADGGASRNGWLMQRQADILQDTVRVSEEGELSAKGAAMCAAKALKVIASGSEDAPRTSYHPVMDKKEAKEKYQGWQEAVNSLL
ncbi:MAG: glycerol kinase GlpK [Lachnospiraceae bacterium]|nr:glycerol kinase GlpK [Lachnospiraceae bacterium]